MMRNILLVLVIICSFYVESATAKISVATPTDCISIYSGDRITRTVRIEVNESGWYSVYAIGDIDVRPDSRKVYVEKGKPRDVYFTIRAPIDVVDDYFSVTFALYDEDDEYLSDTTICVHVSRYGEAAASVTDFSFGAQEYYERGGYIEVPLYVRNTGSADVTVEFQADYSDVRFTKTSVFVRVGDEEVILAKIPSTDSLPSTITFYAYGNNIRKETKLRFTSDTAEQMVDLLVPNDIVLEGDVTRVPVKITNYGSTRVVVTPVIKDGPFGIQSFAETAILYPKQTKIINMLIKSGDVLRTGQRVSELCLLDDAQIAIHCTYVVLIVPSPDAEASRDVVNGEKMVEITINNGAKDYEGVEVNVEAPKGWLARVEPADVFNISAYETANVKVYFLPGDNAEDGLATITVTAPDGTTLAKETVDLNKSELTGLAVLGNVSPIWAVVGLLILALLFFFLNRGGDNNGIEKLKDEITKK